jgi:membrane protease YdiL (CAAX protease family)
MDGPAESPQEQEESVSARSKRRAWTEIGVAYALILAVEWTPRPWQRLLWLVAAAGVVFILSRSFDGWAALGLRAANLARSLWIVGVALAVAGIAIAISAWKHTFLLPDGPLAFAGTYIAYAVWTGVQQFLLQSFFLLRLQRVIPGGWQPALAAALLFAAAHLPNPVLVPITLLWGFASCLLFLRYRNLYPLMMAHAILGITVAITVPAPVVHNMRVGLGYMTYRSHIHAPHMHRLSQP